jgi:hypothetical protein
VPVFQPALLLSAELEEKRPGRTVWITNEMIPSETEVSELHDL